MTMIACTMNEAAPVVIGDLLISDHYKPEEFLIPVLTEDVLQYLSDSSEFHPIRLDQKIYIIKPNVCVAFAGSVYWIKQFLEDLTIFCNSRSTINSELLKEFLEGNKNESWNDFSFLILVVEKKSSHFQTGRFLHGNWRTLNSQIFGEVFASGSGSLDFLKESVELGSVLSQQDSSNINYALQVNIMMISKLLTKERLNLNSLRKYWGAGFEMIYFDGNQFTKLDNITYVINFGLSSNDGEINEVPVPIVILHYKYFQNVLTITVIKPHKGETEVTDIQYIIRSKEFEIRQFIVAPFQYQEFDEIGGHSYNLSFTSNYVSMGYIIETENSHYLPTSFNVGEELEIKYDHPNTVTITMFKDINDRLTKEIKSFLKT